MPKFGFNAPDGTPFDVEAADEASAIRMIHTHVLPDLQKQASRAALAPEPKKPVVLPPMDLNPASGMNPAEKFRTGMGVDTAQTYEGARGLLPPGLLPDQAVDRTPAQQEGDLEALGGWGKAGAIFNNVAMSALPVLRAGKAVGPFVKALGAGRFAPAIADTAANAAHGAVTAREGERLTGAAGAGAATLGTHALARTLRGATPGAGAQELLDKGIQPTFGQVLSETTPGIGAGVRAMEHGIETLPVAGQIMSARTTAQRKALEKAIEAIESRSSGAPIGKKKFRTAVGGDEAAGLRDTAERVLGDISADPISKQIGKQASGLLVDVLAGVSMGPHAPLTASAAAGLYASPFMQRALTGQITLQKAMEAYMKANPRLANATKQSLTQTIRALEEREQKERNATR